MWVGSIMLSPGACTIPSLEFQQIQGGVLPKATTSHSSSAVFLTVGGMFNGLFSLATAIVLSRLATPEEYGAYLQMWLVYHTMMTMLMLGLPDSVTYFIPQMDTRGQKMVIVQTAALLASAGVLISIVVYVFAEPIAGRFGGRPVAELLRLLLLFPIFDLPPMVVELFLIGTHRARASALVGVLSRGLQFVSVVTPVVLGYDFRMVMWALNVSAFVRFVALGVFVMHEYRSVRLIWDVAFMSRLLKYSVPLGLSGIVGALTLQFDRIIVASFFGTREYAIYANGAIELPLVSIITGSVMSVLTPEFVRLYGQGRNIDILRLWHSAVRKVALIFFPVAAFLILYGQDIIVFLFSTRYTESSTVFRIFLLLLFLRITKYGSFLMAAGESSLILKVAGGTLLLSVALNLLFIPLMGLPGAALATVICAYAMGGWQLHWCRRLLKVQWGEIFPWRSLIWIAVISLCGAALATLCTVRMSYGIMRASAGLGVFIVAIGGLMWIVRETQAEIRGIASSILNLR